jgi:hypothetical protein
MSAETFSWSDFAWLMFDFARLVSDFARLMDGQADD